VNDKDRLKAVLRGHAPGGHMPTDIPADLDAAVDRVDQLEEAALRADTAEMLQRLERLTGLVPTSTRATLTMPLVRLVDADGTETVLAEAVVEVELVPAQVLAVLEGRFAAPEPVSSFVSRRITDEGAVAIRALATLLDGQE